MSSRIMYYALSLQESSYTQLVLNMISLKYLLKIANSSILMEMIPLGVIRRVTCRCFLLSVTLP